MCGLARRDVIARARGAGRCPGAGGRARRRAGAPRPGRWRNVVFARRRRPARPSPTRDHRSRPGRRAADGDAGRPAQLVFNGEIYNFRELRAGLEARGERFATASDTEVLLRLLALRRPAGAGARPRHVRARVLGRSSRARCCSRATASASSRSMSQRRRARSSFASEMRALRAARPDRATIRRRRRCSHFSHGAACRRRSPWNARRGSARSGHVDRMAPAVSRGRAAGLPIYASRTSRWTPPPGPCAPRSARGGSAAPSGRACAAHLVADVPVGVFLSGGIDSGAIVSAARVGRRGRICRRSPSASTMRRRRSARARRVAAQFGARASRAAGRRGARRRELPAVLAHLDQPTIDAVNYLLRSRKRSRRPGSKSCCPARAATSCSAAIRRSRVCRARCAPNSWRVRSGRRSRALAGAFVAGAARRALAPLRARATAI